MATDRTEKSEIKRMGAKAQKNSGRSAYAKGDAILGDFLVDVKEAKQSFTLNRNVWGKVSTDAIKHHKEPTLMVALGAGQEIVRLYVVGEEMFRQLYEAYEEKYNV